jgi:hypothetical protein
MPPCLGDLYRCRSCPAGSTKDDNRFAGRSASMERFFIRDFIQANRRISARSIWTSSPT